MLTLEQEKWLSKLSTSEQVCIVPFDNTAEEKFKKLKKQIQSTLGNTVEVWHRGSSSLGICGQDEIDVYIPVTAETFYPMVASVESIFGAPRSILPLQRARFQVYVDDKRIDLFVSNKNHPDWINGVRFEEICRTRKDILHAYQRLKEKMNGLSMQGFYKEKIQFINEILSGN